MTSQALILIIHLIAVVLWMADSRALEYVIQRFRFRRSMPQPATEEEENPFIIDNTKEAVDTKFREMIMTAYKNTPYGGASRWDVWGPEKDYQKTSYFYKTDRSLEPLIDMLMEELEKTEPEIYKIVLRKHLLRKKQRRKEED